MMYGRLLGTGTSTGVPVIGCRCPVCRSSDPRDRRRRCSCYLDIDGIKVLIDAGPDFRQQALDYGVKHVDAVLITHHHFDHVAGLDDLRPLLAKDSPPIPCYTLAESARTITDMFGYIFKDGSYPGVPRLVLREIRAPFDVQSREDPSLSIRVQPIPVRHGELDILGFRIGSFAYLTDVSHIPETSLELLTGLDVLVIDALRDRPHPMHLTMDQSIAIGQRIGARQTWFIHMSHDLSHEEIAQRLPAGMAPAHDGLQFDVESGSGGVDSA